MIWLGDKRGYLTDWTTQQWVRATGRKVSLATNAWLDGPCGGTTLIGRDFFETYAKRQGLEPVESGVRGLLADFSLLEVENPQLAGVDERVRSFYEHTAVFELDGWSEWHGLFRPLGGALSALFSRRLQQLNVPLSPLDTARGMSSKVVPLRDPASGTIRETAWTRELHATGNVIYAGSYSITQVPRHPSPCVKVVFPLPNGNGIVVMKAEAGADGSLMLRSTGSRFGEPGFYFTVQDGDGSATARYVASLKEQIHVYAAEAGTVRADHTLWIWGIGFLRIHYRMRSSAP